MTNTGEQKQSSPAVRGGMRGPGPGGGPGGQGRKIERAKDTRGTLRRLIEYFKQYQFALILVFFMAF